MDIVCEKSVLSSALGIVQRAVAAKSPLPTLKGILFDCKDDQLYLSATDLELGLRCTVNIEVRSPGSVVLPAKLLTEFVRRLPEGNVRLFSDNENPMQVTIACGAVKFNITGFSAEEFPKLPETSDPNTEFAVNEGLFKEMLMQTEVAIAREETRPILTGILLEVDNDKIKLVATDGHRLAYRQAKVEISETTKAVIPGKVVQELIRILDDEGNDLKIHIGNSDITFMVDSIVLSSRLLEGKYPPYQQIIPSDFKTTVVTEAKPLLAALERAEVVAREGANNLVKLSVGEELNISASSPDIGNLEDTVATEKTGEDLDIRFNVKLLLDSLKNIKSQQVSIDLTGEFSPCLIRPLHDHNYIHLVLPVRLS
ncbi:MAG: DNA polymerase III subunit beta [Firmicutes bacterium]|nr:DNA polymerase III subunit beta [Bacillota bacterium]